MHLMRVDWLRALNCVQFCNAFAFNTTECACRLRVLRRVSRQKTHTQETGNLQVIITHPGLDVGTYGFMSFKSRLYGRRVLTQCLSFQNMHHIIQPRLAKGSLKIQTYRSRR